jgi:hypothetical protein
LRPGITGAIGVPVGSFLQADAERRKIAVSFGKSSINRGRVVIGGKICRAISAEPAKTP